MSTQDPIFTAIRNRLLHQLEQDKLVLPSLPEVAIKVQRLAADPNSSMKEISDAITLDPGMSAQMLRLAQTLRYSHPRNPVTTLPDAIVRIGLRGTVNVALSLSVNQLFTFQSPLVCQLCRDLQHKSAQISRYALTLFDEWEARSALDADFIMLAAVLLEIGTLPLLAELDRLAVTSLNLPEPTIIMEWCEEIRVPMGQAMLHKWQLNPVFAATLPLQRHDGMSPAELALLLAHRYQHEQALNGARIAIPLTIEQALVPLPSGKERDTLLEWSKQQTL